MWPWLSAAERERRRTNRASREQAYRTWAAASRRGGYVPTKGAGLPPPSDPSLVIYASQDKPWVVPISAAQLDLLREAGYLVLKVERGEKGPS